MWLVIFPEGTRYNVQNKAVIEKSKKFAAEQGTEVLIFCISNTYLTVLFFSSSLLVVSIVLPSWNHQKMSKGNCQAKGVNMYRGK